MKIQSDIFLEAITACEDSRIYLKPNIPSSKAKNAIKSYANDIDETEIVILADDTVFGGSKEGLIVTEDCIYSKIFANNPQKFKFSQINSIESKKGEIIINGDVFFTFNIIDDVSVKNICNIINNYKNNSGYDSCNTDQDHSESCESIDKKQIDDLKEQSFFYFNKSKYLNTLKQEGISKPVMLLYWKLYNNFLEISSLYTETQFSQDEFLPIVYDNEVLYQSYIFTMFNALQMLSEHLDMDKSIKILEPFGLLGEQFAKYNASPKEKTLESVLNPKAVLLESPEIKELQENLRLYFRAYTNGGDDEGLSDEYKMQKLCDWLASLIKEKVHAKYNEINPKLLDLLFENFDEYIPAYGNYSRRNIEKILIDFFS